MQPDADLLHPLPQRIQHDEPPSAQPNREWQAGLERGGVQCPLVRDPRIGRLCARGGRSAQPILPRRPWPRTPCPWPHRFPGTPEGAGAVGAGTRLSKSGNASMQSISSSDMPARPAKSETVRRRAVRTSYTAFPKASASRIAIRSGSSASSSGRTQRAWSPAITPASHRSLPQAHGGRARRSSARAPLCRSVAAHAGGSSETRSAARPSHQEVHQYVTRAATSGSLTFSSQTCPSR